jgi:hypothetical protein
MKKCFSAVLVGVLALAFLCACNREEHRGAPPVARESSFDPGVLTVKEADLRKVRGQVLYVPIYSNLPHDEKRKFDVSAFIAIHNVDLDHKIRILKVLYFDNDGRLVKDFSPPDLSLPPLGATNFFIPQSDQSGTGANFLVEWVSEKPVREPLIESVMINLETHRSFAFQSRGHVVRERQ